MNPLLRVLTPLLAVLCLSSSAPAQTVTVLAQLGGNPNGYQPQAVLVKGTDGTLYGTTTAGGATNYGTVYKVSTAGKVTTIHTFPGGTGGGVPVGRLVFGKDGNLYGTTTRGGTAGNGTVFRVTTAGTATVLHSFSALSNGSYGSNADGAEPQAGLLLGTDGNFYGTAGSGGANGDGSVFKMTPAGTVTTLHSFSGTSTNDIYAPTTELVEGKDGNFYGTAQGGSDNYAGAVFMLTPAGVLTVLHVFTGGKDGSTPGTLVLGRDGNFYGLTRFFGVTTGGGTASGTAFRITPAGVLTTLHSFDPTTEGSSPVGALIQGQGTDNNFYGATSDYGPANGTPYYGYGTVFKMTPAGALSLVHTFNYTSGTNGGTYDGSAPAAGVILGSDGNFYGTTASGGLGGTSLSGNGYGTIFKLTPSGTLTTLFRGVGGGTQCNARLVESPEGNFYGTTYRGGRSNIGTVFGFAPGGQVVTELSFDDGTTGAYPNGGLLADGQGGYFGFTGIDGPGGWGTLFKLEEVSSTSPAADSANPRPDITGSDLREMEIEYQWDKKPEHDTPDSGGENQGQGSQPTSTTLKERYSKQHGSSGEDGDDEDDDDGALLEQQLPFAMRSGSVMISDSTPAAAPTVLHTFTGGKDGGNPLGALYTDSAGNTFGTTSTGGVNGQGTVYEYTSGGTLKTLYSFKGKGDGSTPAAGVVKGADGNFYGTTQYASYDYTGFSSTGYGTVFKLTPAGVLTTLHTFKDDPDGSVPMAELIEGKDGNFYGTTNAGGSSEAGTVFKITPAGSLTILHSFSRFDGGSQPASAMIQATDGNLYGTTFNCVYRVATVPPVISSAATATATVGKAFSYQITGSNHPTSFGVLGLFNGITVNKQTGLISGTPTAAGKHTLTLQATNVFGTGTKTLTLTVNAAP